MSTSAQDRLIFDTKLKEDRDYWIGRLSRELGEGNLPLDLKRSKVPSKKRHSLELTIPEPTVQRLDKLAKGSDILSYTVLLSALQICLHRYTNAEVIVVGSPPAAEPSGPPPPANALPIVSEMAGAMSFRKLLQAVREALIQAYARQSYPFERLVGDLGVQAADNRCPFFDVTAEFEGLHGPLPALKNDIAIRWRREGQGIKTVVEFNAHLFKRATMERFGAHYTRALTGALASPEMAIDAIDLLGEDEKRQLVVEWNATRAPYSAGACVHALFEAQVERTPDAVAVLFEGQQLTYRELDGRANHLAHRLRGLSIGPDVRVGLGLERSVEMVVGLLGILKAGGAYVPLDPSYPDARLRFMIADAGVQVVVSQRGVAERLLAPGMTLVELDPRSSEESPTRPVSGVGPENLAYVIYTSGSTGKPKGVCMPHRPLVNLLEWQQRDAPMPAGARTVQLTSLNFDVSFQEIFTTWTSGGTLVVAPEAVRQNIQDLPAFLDTHAIERLFVPFVALQHLAEAMEGQELPKLRQVITAGEQLQISPPIMKLFNKLRGVVLYNHYGPSETHVTTSFALRGLSSQWPALPPIGRPIANVQIYILDRHLRPAPIGVTGELYIGGAALFHGYLDRPALTAEKVITDPFCPESGARLYRTGDLARYLPDGNIEFIGRADHQVKIRGHRVELGEIEAAISRHPAVREVVVAAREDVRGGKRLVAYVVPHDGQAIELRALQEFVRERLPAHMVPAASVTLAALPLTRTGKVDRSALPAPEQPRPDEGKTYVAPRTSVEETLARIWAEVLGVQKVGVRDSFFELGGDSILGMQVVARAKQAGIEVIPRQIFKYGTISELAAVVGVARAAVAEQGAVVGPAPLTPIQRWFFEQELVEPHHYNMAVMLEARGSLDAALLERAIQALLAHHDALRMRFVHETNGWSQYGNPTGGAVALRCIDLSALPVDEQRRAMEAAATELQASMDLAQGHLVKAALVQRGAQVPSHLLFVIHHLVVDGVSFRVLLEDLETAYQQLARGEPVRLPPKTTSFQQWAELLGVYARNLELVREAEQWLARPWASAAPLPLDDVQGAAGNTEASARTCSISFSVDETRALLQSAGAAVGASVQDLLITALAWALCRFTHGRTLRIDMEGHGREDIVGQVDLSRTVGWFTSIFPLLLELGEATAPRELLGPVKEQLRRVPSGGIGHGVLRYLAPNEGFAAQLRTLPQAEVSFNYLGQFDGTAQQSALFRASDLPVGPMVSPRARRFTRLYVGGIVLGGQLRIDFVYSEDLFRAATIDVLVQDFAEGLRDLLRPGVEEAPSAFPRANLSQGDLAELFSQLGGEAGEE